MDWSHLVHQVRTRKPGALEVLQDAINEWFPQQFAAAKKEANRRAFQHQQSIYYGKTTFWVGFDARKARQRFLPVGIRALPADNPPFVVRDAKSIHTWKGRPIAYVYSTTGRRSSTTGELPKRHERKALRPRYTGSYKRPKLPTIWFRESTEDEPDTDDGPEKVHLYVRGRKAALWVREHPEVLGEPWDAQGPNWAATSVYNPGKNWRRELRREGYRNKLKYLEYDPPRQWLTAVP